MTFERRSISTSYSGSKEDLETYLQIERRLHDETGLALHPLHELVEEDLGRGTDPADPGGGGGGRGERGGWSGKSGSGGEKVICSVHYQELTQYVIVTDNFPVHLPREYCT